MILSNIIYFAWMGALYTKRNTAHVCVSGSSIYLYYVIMFLSNIIYSRGTLNSFLMSNNHYEMTGFIFKPGNHKNFQNVNIFELTGQTDQPPGGSLLRESERG